MKRSAMMPSQPRSLPTEGAYRRERRGLGRCSGMTPEDLPSTDAEVPMRDLKPGQVWWAFVVAGVRSKVGATLLALGLALSVWLFVTGHMT
jgi:hypothetical protein